MLPSLCFIRDILQVCLKASLSVNPKKLAQKVNFRRKIFGVFESNIYIQNKLIIIRNSIFVVYVYGTFHDFSVNVMKK